MSKVPKNNVHLSNESRIIIKYNLLKGETPENIISSWEYDIHKRGPPTIQTVYKIKRLVDHGESVEIKKKGPKRRSVLTQEKLVEIEKAIEKNGFTTGREIGSLVDLPKSTA